MSLDVYFYFDGDCKDALKFYASAFGLPETTQIMTYGQMPGYDGPEADKDRVLHAYLPIGGGMTMFSDVPTGRAYVKGTNISPTVSFDSEDEVRTVFDALSVGGTVSMPLGKTFFSPLYGMVTDKFGVTWQVGVISHS
ncbi:MAG: VOC family protein [Bifidobacteriaceae bacterium]|jgi:PhnB protein|nr:VOC family protein [Bifidobacteriaceae bacterium]